MITRIPVTGAAPYDVVVGAFDEATFARELGGMLTGALGYASTRAGLVVADEPALGGRIEAVRSALVGLGLAVTDIVVPAGEAGKTAAVASACWEALGAAGFTRSDVIVTVGGGATTDLGGFVAATWLRGIPVVHVPTTLLAMVDAAVGGKTGINTGSGKNLVGAFHEPAGVLCDVTALATLPTADLTAGLGEVVKCGFFADLDILPLIHSVPRAALVWESPVLRELIERAIAVKAAVVSADLREQGGQDGHPGREALNYGHTLAHAIERVSDYGVRHGEAVAIGCVFVAELAARVTGLSADDVERHRAALAHVGLPVTYDGDVDALLEAMKVDKKSRGNLLRFVLLRHLGEPVVVEGPDMAAVRAAYAAIGGAL